MKEPKIKRVLKKSRGKEVPVIMWLCRCECGTEQIISGGRLRARRTKQCKNCASESLTKDLTGLRFGKLTAIERTSKNDKTHWICQCDCGNITCVEIGNLRNNGGTQSCGCVGKEKNRERNQQIKAASGIKRQQEKEEKRMLSAERKEERFKNKFHERYGNAFEYIGGYRSNDSKAKIIIGCKKCGAVRERNRGKIFAPQANIECKECGANRKELVVPFVNCVNCGKGFLQYTPQQILCKECKHKQDREKNNIRKRIRETRMKANGKIDYSVTLSKIVERDKHICKLCGRKVNESDYVYVGETFIAGNDYPSIDHIIPLSKGGLHQWDNVQLAHRLCNSVKCDKLV